ncbi:hypothetical protein EB001_14115 [bacterium]|nr:hypothetical protein [bacterium]
MLYTEPELEDIDINEEEDIIFILHKGGDFSIIPPEDEDNVSHIQVVLLEQIIVSVRPSIFLLIALKIEISFVRLWGWLTNSDT